jgi:hypothetical protein
MNTIKMKILSFNANSGHLQVSFASDVTNSQDPADYNSYAYHLPTMWPDLTDPVEIQRRIAMSGVSIANNQKAQEDLEANTARVEFYQSLVGQTAEYSLTDLFTPSSDTIPSNEITG